MKRYTDQILEIDKKARIMINAESIEAQELFKTMKPGDILYYDNIYAEKRANVECTNGIIPGWMIGVFTDNTFDARNEVDGLAAVVLWNTLVQKMRRG